ncbi:MAG: cobalamin B12-binding domain-containing protein, partial [Deltaproteobacteria bacterium]
MDSFSKENPATAHRTRFITAASLFDGHDAAINIMRRILQSTGAEVIHLGHNRSANTILKAALEEDAQAIAISSYQGGHVEFFKYIVDLLKKRNLSHIRVFGGGGGTITPDEITDLEKYGVKKIYSPEDGRKLGLQGIIDHMMENAALHPFQTIDWEHLKDFSKSTKALAQALTCIELGEEGFDDPHFASKKTFFESLKQQVSSTPSKSTVIGLTGPGGAG